MDDVDDVEKREVVNTKGDSFAPGNAPGRAR